METSHFLITNLWWDSSKVNLNSFNLASYDGGDES